MMRKECWMLAVEGLNAWWGHAQALFDVHLQVDEGELVVLQVLDTTPRSLMGDSNWRDARVSDLLEVSAYFNTRMQDRIKMLEQRVDELTDHVWGED